MWLGSSVGRVLAEALGSSPDRATIFPFSSPKTYIPFKAELVHFCQSNTSYYLKVLLLIKSSHSTVQHI